MTARVHSVPSARAFVPRRIAGSPLGRAITVASLLAVAIAARWAVTVGAQADGLVVGAAFGVGLIAVVGLVGWRPQPFTWRQLAGQGAVGLVAGSGLVALALAVRWPGPWIPIDPAGSFVPWAAVTLLVATGEELLLRGALFDAVDEAGGTAIALIATSIVFALLHVPLYGWHVVPLDLGVGLVLGGLRVLTGGVVAPSVGHVVADIATWWI